MKIRDIVMIAMLSAILFAAQVALRLIPNVELVTVLIILYTILFGRKTLYIIYIFVFLEGLIYGIGPWWYGYLYVWAILYFIARLNRNKYSPLLWAIISGGYGLIFGGLFAIINLFTMGIPGAVAFWIAGIPFDVIHCVSNFIITLCLFLPLHNVIKQLQIRYNSNY